MLACPAGVVAFSVATPAGQLKYDNAAARGIVAALAGGPMRLGDIVAKSAVDPQDAVANALVLCAADAVRPVEGDRAPVTDINRTIRRRLGSGQEILHLALSCGTALPIKDTLLQILRDGENAKDGEAGQWREYLASLGV
jgi:hypothetical protein